ncbi:hypothetical protein BZG36_02615 [Bifiguratus adelaidae]|uniref:Terpene synthase n=1 Tax=Bifiguratus adelaidae TaxID=1938954 RepID=A0A261Y2K4_9FUNG|nr:hypothetical protein BZG36_02615 [Bifiguratus adelaidae]
MVGYQMIDVRERVHILSHLPLRFPLVNEYRALFPAPDTAAMRRWAHMANYLFPYVKKDQVPLVWEFLGYLYSLDDLIDGDEDGMVADDDHIKEIAKGAIGIILHGVSEKHFTVSLEGANMEELDVVGDRVHELIMQEIYGLSIEDGNDDSEAPIPRPGTNHGHILLSRLAKAFEEYFVACADANRLAAKGNDITLAEYEQIRFREVGQGVLMVFVEILIYGQYRREMETECECKRSKEPFVFSNQVFADRLTQELIFKSGNIYGFTNDLVSVERDLKAGQATNLVCVLDAQSRRPSRPKQKQRSCLDSFRGVKCSVRSPPFTKSIPKPLRRLSTNVSQWHTSFDDSSSTLIKTSSSEGFPEKGDAKPTPRRSLTISVPALMRSIDLVNAMILDYNRTEALFLERLAKHYNYTPEQLEFARKWCAGATCIMVGNFLWSLETDRYKSRTHIFKELRL